MVGSVRSMLRVAVVCTLLFAVIGATAKKAPWHIPWNLYAHAQDLVDVGGRRMNIVCSGSGAPAVILDAGFGADASAWRVVQPRIALHTRVCSYDRAGMGFSDPAGAPRDARAIASDLHTLLRRAGIAPPYVLVGWSSAGLYSLFYANAYPADVVGLVEVDPATPYEDVVLPKMDPGFWPRIRTQTRAYELCEVTISQGKCPFFNLAEYRKLLRSIGCPHISPEACAVSEVTGEHETRPSFWRDEALENAAVTDSMDEDRAEQRNFGDLPLIVLTDSEQGDIEPDGPFSLAQQREMWRATERLQEHLTRLSSVGEHFVVAGSTHAIQLSQPAAVVSAIDEVLDQARYGMHGEEK